MSAQIPEPDAVAGPGVDRRGLMRNAAGLGVAGLAAGALLSAGTAAAAEPATADDHTRTPAHEPLVVHVRDAATGELDLYHGERHRRVVDRDLAAALARHAR